MSRWAAERAQPGQRGVARGENRSRPWKLERGRQPAHQPPLGVRGDDQRRAGPAPKCPLGDAPQQERAPRPCGRGSRRPAATRRSRGRGSRSRSAGRCAPPWSRRPPRVGLPPPAPRSPFGRDAQILHDLLGQKVGRRFGADLEDVEQLDRPREARPSAPAVATTAADAAERSVAQRMVSMPRGGAAIGAGVKRDPASSRRGACESSAGLAAGRANPARCGPEPASRSRSRIDSPATWREPSVTTSPLTSASTSVERRAARGAPSGRAALRRDHRRLLRHHRGPPDARAAIRAAPPRSRASSSRCCSGSTSSFAAPTTRPTSSAARASAACTSGSTCPRCTC